jgi:chemotaxis protein MotB
MVKARVVLLVVWALVCSGGCAPTEKRDLEFELRKAGQERDGLRGQLASERAKSAALQKQTEATAAELSTSRAEVGHLNDRLQGLSQQNQQLQVVLDQLKTRELKRPALPASPLPTATDDALQALVRKYGDRVWYDQGRGALSFANDRLFDSGSDVVRADAHAALHELAGILASQDLAEHEIIVVGHTDATPITKPETVAQHPTNWHLSVHRAIAVKDVLVKAGVPASRLGVMGYADNRPIGDEPAKNRRVEVFVVRKGTIEAFQAVRPSAK